MPVRSETSRRTTDEIQALSWEKRVRKQAKRSPAPCFALVRGIKSVMGNKKKKVTICASGAFIKEARQWQKRLERKNYRVIQIPRQLKRDYASIHQLHYRKIAESDILFVLNLKKDGIKNYIGPSVFAEIAFAIGLNLVFRKRIKVFCLNPIPKNLPYSTELLLWRKVGWIQKWKKV